MSTKIEIEVTGNGNNTVSATNSKVQEYAKQTEIAMQEAQKSAELAQKSIEDLEKSKQTFADFAYEKYKDEVDLNYADISQQIEDQRNSLVDYVQNCKGDIEVACIGYSSAGNTWDNPSNESYLGKLLTKLNNCIVELENKKTEFITDITTAKNEAIKNIQASGNSTSCTPDYNNATTIDVTNGYTIPYDCILKVFATAAIKTSATVYTSVGNYSVQPLELFLLPMPANSTITAITGSGYNAYIIPYKTKTSTDSGYTGGKDVD